MRSWWVFLILLSLPLLPRAADRAWAQVPPAAGIVKPPPAVVEEVKPSGLYLRNEEGELVYVPDISYEQFEQMLKVQRNLAHPQRPAFVMTNMTIMASIAGTRLELDVEFTLEGRALEGVEAGTWFHVPLRQDNAVLQKEPVFEGPGGHFLTFDGGQDGYVCWLQSGEEATHKVKLQLLLPIEQAGDESVVSLSAPTPLASTLTLHVAAESAEGLVRELAASAGRPLAFESTSDGQGQLVARGIRGDVTLSWHASPVSEPPVNTRLDVFGAILVTADEMLQEVSSDGRFVVRAFGGPIDVFRVRLPPGMRLRETPEPGYQVRVLPLEESEPAAGQLVEVDLGRPTTGQVEIRLLAEVPTTSDDPAWPLTVARLIDQSEEFAPGRFEFVGAVRHRGHIDVVLRGDLALEDRGDPDFPRVAPTAASVGTDAVAARFQYYNQDRTLKVALHQKATRISVEPTYEVYVDAEQARLFARLECRTSGSKAAPLAIRLPFWTVEIVNFADVDSPPPMELTETNPLVVPIPMAAQSAGEFTLNIEARLNLTASVVSGTGPLRVVLPLLEATNPSRANVIVSPATVTIIPADNILLTPRPQQMKALSPLVMPRSVTTLDVPREVESVPATGVETTTTGEQEPLQFRYRDRGSSEQAVFVGDMRIEPQAISVAVASTATLSRTAMSVEQRLSYVVLHEPVATLMFTLPASLAGDAGVGWRLFRDEQPLIPTIEPGVGNERPRARVRLPQPILGPLELRVVHARQPMPELTDDAISKLRIPLVLPSTRNDSNTTLVENTLTVLREDSLHVEPAGGAWVVEDSESGAGQLVLATSAEGTDPLLQISRRRTSPAGTTVMHQLWIQSWLTERWRRDRAVFKISTSEPRLRVTLPQLAATEVRLVKVAVDRLDVVSEGPGPHGEITIPVPPASGTMPQEHVVEVWYLLAAPRIARGQLSLEAATLDAKDRVERMYWQVILPRGDVVVSRDPRLTAERRWQWDQFGWRRYPAQDQAELEQWIGASRQEPSPSEANRYLFTTFGAVRQLELITASRSWILLACSGITLMIGLVLLYVPVLRHPVLLLVAGAITAALGLMWPDLAILFSQAALLGVLLVLVARVFRQWLWRTVTPTVQGRTQFSDSKFRIGENVVSRAEGSSRISATSPPASVQVSAADSKS
ncbi:MAG: hypothetical protein ACYC6N_00075 [Pirellulaceae bacterium]